MTFKEKLQMEHPKKVNELVPGGCIGCPDNYGYEKREGCEGRTCTECWNREIPGTEPKPEIDASDYIDIYTNGYNKGHDEGMKDVWEFVKKTDTAVKPEEARKMLDFFGVKNYRDIFKKYTPPEAIAKLKAYEDSKIEVGDVVESNINKKRYLVLAETNDDGWDFIALDIEQLEVTKIADSHYYFKKTDKHIDIKSFLEQIGE